MMQQLQMVAGNTVVNRLLSAPVRPLFLQRDDPPPAPSTAPQKAPPGPGKHKGEKVGTWGVYAQTPLTAKTREDRDFGGQEAAVAYARGLQKASCVFNEDGTFVVYQVDYSWWSGFSSFTYSGTRMTKDSPISDVKGEPGVLALITEDGVPILPHQYGTEANYKDWMDQQDALKPGDNPFDAHKEAYGAGLGKITGKDKVINEFLMAMRDVALSTLDKSKVVAEDKRKELAGPQATADTASLRDVANRLRDKDLELRDWKKKLDYHETPAFLFQGKQIAECKAKIAILEQDRGHILMEYPLLSQLQEPDADGVIESQEFAALSDTDKAARLGDYTKQILDNISHTRTNVISGQLNLWMHQPLVDTTIAGLGIRDAERTGWISEKVGDEKAGEQVDKTLMMLLQVGLTALAAAFSGGLAGAAFAVGAGAASLHDAITSTQDVAARDAASNTDVNKANALVPGDVRGEWAALVATWIGVGLTFMDAVEAVRAIKVKAPTLDAARGAGAVEEEITALGKKQPAIDQNALRQSAGMAGKVPPSVDTLRQTLLSAMPTDELRVQFKDVAVQILDDEQFVKQFGSASGEAVTTIDKGAKGELIPQVHFKKSGNPLAMREEAVHIAQTTDPAMAAKMAQLSEANLAAWKTLETPAQLQLYRTKIEVEIDAQRRLLAQFAGGDEMYLTGVKANLETLETRLKDVEEAIRDPVAFDKNRPPWWDPDQPPRMFAKRAPSEFWGEWSGRPGNSEWHDDRPEVQKYTGKDRGIPFRNWDPDFSEWSVYDVNITMSGFDDDFAAADFAAAQEQVNRGDMAYAYRGKPSAKAVKSWRQENGYTWHHVRGGSRMQLVPTELHSKIAHEGGAAEARLAGR